MAQSGAWAAGIAGALQGLTKGIQDKNQRNLDKANQMVLLTAQDLQIAQDRAAAMPGDPEAGKALGAAHDAYEKSLKEVQKHAKTDPAVWGRIKQAIDGMVKPGQKKPAQGQGGPQPAPVPVASGPAGPPQAQQPNLNARWATSFQQTAAEEQKLKGLQAQQTEGVAQEQIDEITARRATVKAVQDFMQDKDYDKALQTIRRNANYGFGKQPGQETLAEMSLLDVAQQMGVNLPDAENKRKALKEKYELETKQRQLQPKYATGTAAQTFLDAGVGLKPLGEYTQEDWVKVAEFRKKQYEDKKQEMQKKISASAGAHDHSFQKFQAATAADRAIITRDETRAA
jgi:hypothetical protein